MTVTLLPPSFAYEGSYRDYIAELGAEERYPFQMDLPHSDFSALLERLRDFSDGNRIPSDYVRTSTYWLVDGAELIGVSSLRPHLNKELAECGGHIGLGIRPSYRGRGLGTTLLGLTLREAWRIGMGDVHVHCHKGNQASVRMIRANGGLLHSETSAGDPGVTVQRYVVPAPGVRFTDAGVIS